MRGVHRVTRDSHTGQTLRHRPVTDEAFPGPPPNVVRRYDESIGKLVSLPEALAAHSLSDANYCRTTVTREWLMLSQASPPAPPPPLAPPADAPSTETPPAEKLQGERVDETQWGHRGYKDPKTGVWTPWTDADVPQDPFIRRLLRIRRSSRIFLRFWWFLRRLRETSPPLYRVTDHQPGGRASLRRSRADRVKKLRGVG